MTEIIHLYTERLRRQVRRAAGRLKPPVKVRARHESERVMARHKASRLGLRVVDTRDNQLAELIRRATSARCAGCGCALDSRKSLGLRVRGDTTMLYCVPCGFERDSAPEMSITFGKSPAWQSCVECFGDIAPGEQCAYDSIRLETSCIDCCGGRA